MFDGAFSYYLLLILFSCLCLSLYQALIQVAYNHASPESYLSPWVCRLASLVRTKVTGLSFLCLRRVSIDGIGTGGGGGLGMVYFSVLLLFNVRSYLFSLFDTFISSSSICALDVLA